VTEAAASEPRRPRDAQRARVYRAESVVPSSPLPGLPACVAFAEKVVGSLWWIARFPDHGLGGLPRFRPGNGARQAFYRHEPGGPTITLPRRYRTKGVVLHELVHWALAPAPDLAHHGTTFARVLVDATTEFCGPERAAALEAAYAAEGVRIGAPASVVDGRLVYGADERWCVARRRGRVATPHARAAS
jgi:putative metallohydrolase (TIGR04338 family)